MAHPALKSLQPMAKHPRYAAVLSQIAEMNAALVQVIGRKREIEALLAKHQDHDERVSDHTAAALEFARTGIVQRPINAPTELQEQHLLLRAQEESLGVTISKLRDHLYQVERDLNGEASRQVRAGHDEMCVRYAKALRALVTLHDEELGLTADASRLGYSLHLERRILDPEISQAVGSQLREFPL